MRRWVGLAVLAIPGVVAAGCMGGGSQHATLSATDALAQARDDGLVKPERASGQSWHCARPSETDAPAYRPNYAFSFGDKRVPPTSGNSARIGMMVVVFPDAATAQRCAEAGIYGATHTPVHPSNALGPFMPYKLIGSTTVKTHMHAPGAPGSVSAEDDGEYDTWLAHGRVLAFGLAYNEPDSKIVREDLDQLAAEIAG
jgi:hypothetical protein